MRDQGLSNSRVAAIIKTKNEVSVNQARWILIPLFGLWILVPAAGMILG
ncbi:hypothetical protein NKH47_02960 [Mesorhizobium sp. M1060]|nr:MULTISPECIES: hypothetical protein [unclassified Mesorhizobium]ESW84837.1 hypothetical protein X773_09035 [Mesorhizobium sp. LSJC285A00]ESX09135.1 hypothetical protein X768_19955 [Mesorhizobium sp. LSJC265A00]ESX20308.1 hypothetical protein X766_08325 [Mesorhizobium sp. LSJC255A00]ESZ61945.1 hypothetical protein X729_12205 [Mesorhizobium sp. L103C131B0]